MDVDGMDFLEEYEDHRRPRNESLYDYKEEPEFIGRDPATGSEMYALTSENEQPLAKDEHGVLKFKMNNIATENMAYLTQLSKSKIFPTRIPRVDMSREYEHYISKLFEIYNELDEHRIYFVPTIGLVNNSYFKEHNSILNIAWEAFCTELEFFIESLKGNPDAYYRLDALEECLHILNCLKTIHFTLDSNNDGGYRKQLIDNLLNWINRSDGMPTESFIEDVFQSRTDGQEIFQTAKFWKLINQLLLRGLYKQVVGCFEKSGLLTYLEGQCDVSANVIQDIVALINQYPEDSSQTFREWKSLVLELQQSYTDSETHISGELRDCIEDTLLVISGNQSKILQYSSKWYESFSGFLLYYIPSLELSNEYLQLSLDVNPLNLTNGWEQPCVDIINNKIYSILPRLETLDTCTAAFAAALCGAKGLLENYIEEDSEVEVGSFEDLLSKRNGMASYLLNNFAFELCSHKSKNLWPVAIGLISISPVESSDAKRLAISELLPRFPFSTNDDIEWMLTVCAKWRLPQVAKKIYTILGNRLISEGNTIEALTNFSKAGKFDLVKHHSWMLFESSIFNGKPLDDLVLNSIVENNIDNIIPGELLDTLVTNSMRQSLSPYAVLFQFYEAKSNARWEEALQLLLALLEFEFLPKHYFLLLVAKFLLPFYLSKDDVDINEASLLRIMQCLNDKLDSNDSKSKELYDILEEQEHMLVKNEGMPDTIDQLNKLVRKKVNFKLSHEFM